MVRCGVRSGGTVWQQQHGSRHSWIWCVRLSDCCVTQHRRTALVVGVNSLVIVLASNSDREAQSTMHGNFDYGGGQQLLSLRGGGGRSDGSDGSGGSSSGSGGGGSYSSGRYQLRCDSVQLPLTAASDPSTPETQHTVQ